MEPAAISKQLCSTLLEAAARQAGSPEELADAHPVAAAHDRVVDFRADRLSVSIPTNLAIRRLSAIVGDDKLAADLLRLAQQPQALVATSQGLQWSDSQLKRLGMLLVPFYSQGILNGGAATSYFDEKKNQGFAPLLFERNRDLYRSCQASWGKSPKGMCPAWFSSQGRPGPSFFTHKIDTMQWFQEAAIALLHGLEAPAVPFPYGAPHLFQMTNPATQDLLDNEFRQLVSIRNYSGLAKPAILSASQELGAALDLSKPLAPKLFDQAFGQPDTLLPLPAGHGQAFLVLKDVFNQLHASGIRFVSIGNIDNIAYAPHPQAIAYLALTGKPALFEFSYKTGMDIKGGILLEKGNGNIFCGDIGQAVPAEMVLDFEAQGLPILFNCANGLFDLSWLIEHVEQLYATLPIRISEQHKPAGHYWQAEQNLWDCIAGIPNAVFAAVEKKKRFIPAKLFADTLLVSRQGMHEPEPSGPELDIWQHGLYLSEGLEELKTWGRS